MNETQNVELILATANKLFEKERYLAAKKEFEKIREAPNAEDVLEKIEICNEELALLKANELVKQARKHLKKEDLAQALTSFEEANLILNEDWIVKQMQNLKHLLAGKSTVNETVDAKK
ncbi:hypothetical protein WDW89_08645 [Deltaproteobacteria bacterium TL4]